MNKFLHQQMIDKVVDYARKDQKIMAVAIGGSYITNEVDEFSDLDFIIVVSDQNFDSILKQRHMIVSQFGQLLSCFTGEHVAEPRLMICLYDNPILHVDFKFISLSQASKRVENPVILYQEDDCLSKEFLKENAVFPMPDLQWIEDRFWVWIHYATTKLGRGELFEVIDFLSFIRQTVLSPLILMKNNKLPRGVRKIEVDAPIQSKDLEKTVAIHEKESCIEAIQACIDLYLLLREDHKSAHVIKKEQAQIVAIKYFNEISMR